MERDLVHYALAGVSRMRAEAPPVNPALVDFIGAPTKGATTLQNVKSAAPNPIPISYFIPMGRE